MRKLRVCLNLQEAPNAHMGIAQYELNLARRLAAMEQYDVRGVVHRMKQRIEVPFKVTVSKVPYRYCFNQSWFNRLCPLSYNATFGDFRSDVSVFFANKMPLMKVRGKCIGVIHDVIPFRLSESEQLATGWWTKQSLDFYKYQHHYLAGHADCIVTDSLFSKREIIDVLGVDERRIRIVGAGVDYERFARVDGRRDQQVRSKYNLPDRYFLYFGTLAKYKNVANLIRGYARLPLDIRRDVPLLITQKSEKLMSLAVSLGVGDQVRFLGFVDEEDKPSLYRQASAAGFVSRLEGFGIPAVEAMAAGTPLLASTCASLPEVVGDAALSVDPDDLKGIAMSMERVLADPSVRNRMIEKGRCRAQKLTWDHAARQLAAVVDEVCA